MKIALLGTEARSVLGFRSDLIKKLVANKCVVYAFATDYTDSSRKSIIALGAIPVDYQLNRTSLNPFLDLLHTYKLSKQLKLLNLDLVFSYFVKPVIFGTLAAKIAGVPRRIGMLEGLGYVFTDEKNGISLKIKFLRKVQVLLYRLSFPFLDRLIFLNPDDPKDLVDKFKLPVKAVSVLGGIGVDLKQYPYNAAPSSPVSFVFIGRLLAEKGIHEFVEAARIVKGLYPDVTFLVLGSLDPKNPSSLSQNELNKLIADEVVTCPGHVSNVQDWIVNSSVFVLPSYYREGVPRSTQEAMAIGRAVITTDVPGCRETVIDGVNGFLIPPWSGQELADKMLIFVENPHKIIEMGEQSSKIAREKFDSEIVNLKLLDLLGVNLG